MESSDKDPRKSGFSIPDMLGSLVSDLTGLVRSEANLVRAELAEAGKTMAVGAEMVAAGAILLLVALLVLVQALVVVLALFVGPAWAALALGVIIAAIGAVLIMRGKKDMSAANLVPERAIEQASQDARLTGKQMMN